MEGLSDFVEGASLEQRPLRNIFFEIFWGTWTILPIALVRCTVSVGSHQNRFDTDQDSSTTITTRTILNWLGEEDDGVAPRQASISPTPTLAPLDRIQQVAGTTERCTTKCPDWRPYLTACPSGELVEPRVLLAPRGSGRPGRPGAFPLRFPVSGAAG